MSNKLIKNNLLNHLMVCGGKNTSETILFKSVKKIQKKNIKKNFGDIIQSAIINSSPHVLTKKIKRKKKVPLEFPFLLKKKLRISHGSKSLIQSAKKDLSNNSLYTSIVKEVLESSKLQGSSVNKILLSYKKAFASKKLANYRWF